MGLFKILFGVVMLPVLIALAIGFVWFLLSDAQETKDHEA